MASPLEQFTIKTIAEVPGGFDFTNSSLWMTLAVATATIFLVGGMRKREMVPGPWQSMAESVYVFIGDMIRDNVGAQGRKFFPLVFTIFMFVLLGNALGMIPGSFTFTSHIVVTGVLAIFVFLFVTLVGLVKHGLHFFSFFVPEGAPKALYPLIIPIEVISYLSRPVSLSVRLFANMVAGHTMLKVFAGFVISLGAVTFGIGGIAPIILNVLLIGFEFMIAFIQAYVFTLLTCLYLNDALHLH
ncbi:MAG: F0F1 ATP synthase subunit A [Alphaproteobacteria bacterium]|nr:F0F1 ATP synthase subunit A [Alphaproteobacteria bacterium]